MEVAGVIPILLVREAEAYTVWKITEYNFEPKSYGLRSPVLTSTAYASCSGLMFHLSQQGCWQSSNSRVGAQMLRQGTNGGGPATAMAMAGQSGISEGHRPAWDIWSTHSTKGWGAAHWEPPGPRALEHARRPSLARGAWRPTHFALAWPSL